MKKIKVNSLEHKLLLCCKTGTLEEVIDFINAGADVNARVPFINDDIEDKRYGAYAWCRPVHLAALNPDIRIIQHLHTVGAKLNVYTFEGWNPLHWAVFNNSLEMFHYLIQQGLDPNITDKYGQNLLYHAVRNPHREVFTEILSYGVDINHRADDETVLDTACKFGTIEDIAFLIDQGIDIREYLKETTDIRHYNNENFRYLLECCIKQGIDLDECIGDKTFYGSWGIENVFSELGLESIIQIGH
jgi:ankyrin repeat protein